MSTKTHPDDPRTSLPPSVVILGNDAQLAARPATPVQLAHACLAAGYRAVVPASWGDELVAAATIQALTKHEVRPAIQCVCPHVARRVLAVGSDLSPYLVSLVAPPVAAARYVRQNSPNGVRITYIGRCPAAGDDSIDARLTPEELLAQLAERGIRLADQPTVFESIIPPDRRRHRSQPGGLPSPDALWGADQPTTVELISEDDLASELAEKVLAATNSLLDLAPSVGCACAGAHAGALAYRARADVVALEPPRASAPVVDEQFAVGLEMALPAAARSPFDIIAPHSDDVDPQWAPFEVLETEAETPTPVTEQATRRPRFTPPESENPTAASRRRPSPPAGRVIPGSMPVGSDQEGRVLPRAYVARRRSPRGGVPVVSEPVSRSAPPEPIPSSTAAPPGKPRHATAAAPAKQDVQVKPSETKDPLRNTPLIRGRAQPHPAEPVAAVQSAPAAPSERSEAVPPAPARQSEAKERGSSHESAEPFFARLKAWPARADRDLPPARPVITPDGANAPPSVNRSSDSELPIAQSVEPPRVSNGSRAGIAPTLPVLVDQVRRTTERVSGGVRALVVRSPRAAIVVVLTAVVLLGVAIGYAAANKSTDATTSGEAGGQLEDQRLPAAPGKDADSLRAGASRRDSTSRGGASLSPRRVRRPSRTGRRGAASAPTAESAATEPPAPDATVPPQDAGRPVAASGADSAASRTRDSVAARTAASAGRADSMATEREALRQELARRRARLDSIARRVEGLKPDQR